MNQSSQTNGFIFLGTIGGTVSGFCNLVQQHDLVQTAVLSAVGAMVSFMVSWVLGVIVRKRKK